MPIPNGWTNVAIHPKAKQVLIKAKNKADKTDQLKKHSIQQMANIIIFAWDKSK